MGVYQKAGVAQDRWCIKISNTRLIGDHIPVPWQIAMILSLSMLDTVYVLIL